MSLSQVRSQYLNLRKSVMSVFSSATTRDLWLQDTGNMMFMCNNTHSWGLSQAWVHVLLMPPQLLKKTC